MKSDLRELTLDPIVNIMEWGPALYTVSVMFLWGDVWCRDVFGVEELKRAVEEAEAVAEEVRRKYS